MNRQPGASVSVSARSQIPSPTPALGPRQGPLSFGPCERARRLGSGQSLDAIEPEAVGRRDIRELRQAVRPKNRRANGLPWVAGHVAPAPNLITFLRRTLPGNGAPAAGQRDAFDFEQRKRVCGNGARDIFGLVVEPIPVGVGIRSGLLRSEQRKILALE